MIKVKDERKPQLYTYSWAHINASPTPQAIDWLPVSLQEETTDHIRCHHLQRESVDVPLLMATLGSSSSIKAVIVINSENSYRVDPKYFPEEEKWLVPVFIVTSTTGKMIMDTISKQEEDILASVDTAIPGIGLFVLYYFYRHIVNLLTCYRSHVFCSMAAKSRFLHSIRPWPPFSGDIAAKWKRKCTCT